MIKHKLKSVTIGIPAYNEEANIGYLLDDLCSQIVSELTIDRIIVVSDGSTDKTTEIVLSRKDPRILLLEGKKREGQAETQNKILKHTKSDILVLLNADIEIRDPSFLKKLVMPVTHSDADLTSAQIKELSPKTFFGAVIVASAELKKIMYESVNNGNHVYTCVGRARAFSKRLYKKLHFPTSVGEDAYSYFLCRSLGYSYKYVKQAEIYNRSPENLQDHERQSIRFLQSKDYLEKYFDSDQVKRSYKLPQKVILKALAYSFWRAPIHTSVYVVVFIWMSIRSKFVDYTSSIWRVAESSKILRLD